MKQFFQKYLDKLFVAIVILFAALPTSASTKIGDLYYNLDSSTYTAEVTSYSPSSDGNQHYVKGEITIPASVTYDSKIYSVTSIGMSSFDSCTGLTSIIIPNSVTSIGSFAFYNCSGLTEITIPNSVTSIENSTFYGCSGLTEITIPNSVTSIEISAFRGCSGLTNIIIPNCITTIEASAFRDCSGLTSITIPTSVTSIKGYAFSGCSGLTRLTIPNSVTNIEGSSFYECSSITEVVLEDGENTLSLGSFDSCPLEKVYIGRNLSYSSSYNSSPFANQKNLTDVSIGNKITNLGENLFYNCSGLRSIIIPNSVTAIGSSAFRGCSGLISITLPNSVTSIRASAFSGCSALTSITIPNSVTSIGTSAFNGCSGLTSITIPRSVTSIENSAFNGCSSITEVVLEDGENTLDLGYNFSSKTGLFGECPLEKVYIGRNLSYYYTVYYGYSPFAIQNKLTDVAIGNNVIKLGEDLFYNCNVLTRITIPNSVTSIGDYAFYGCNNIKSIFYSPGESFAKIGKGQFTEIYSTANVFIDIPEKTFEILNNEEWNRFSHIYYLSNGKEYVPTLWNTPVFAQNIIYSDERGFLSEPGIPVILKSDKNIVFALWEGINILEELVSSSGFSVNPELNWRLNVLYISSDSELYKSVTLPMAGELFNQLGLQEIQKIEYLKIIGDINGTDVMTLNRMIQLRVIDLSEANIVEGGQTYRDNLKTSTNVIGSYFFWELKNLQNVFLPSGVETIDSYAFQSNVALTSISIPSSVLSILNNAFDGCNSLKYVILEDGENNLSLGYNSSKSGLYSSCPLEKVYIGRNLTYTSGSSYGYSPFANQNNLTNVSFGNNVTNIGEYLFYNCSGLPNILIPNSITTIGKSAFSGCTGLTNIAIPNSIKSIREATFSGCSNLTDITIPNSVTYIGNHALRSCIGLLSITIPNSVISIGDYAFYDCSGLTGIIIPNSVYSIGEFAFKGCSGLKSIIIPNSVNSTSPYAFEDCSSLTDVILEDGENSLKVSIGLFKSCPLENLYIGRNLSYTSSSWSPFENQKDLTNVTISNNVKSLGSYFFSNCSGLKSISIPISVTSIGNYAFSGCSGLTSVTIPNSVNSIGEFAFKGCSGLTNIVIPETVSSIENSTFKGCSGLTSITIPDSVNSIGSSAFEGCSSLTNIAIPKSLSSIENSTFSSCSSLTSVTIPNSVNSIGMNAFDGCKSLAELTIEDGDSTLELGSNSSKSGLYSSCPLEKVYIGRNLSYTSGSSYGYSPFANLKNLTDVTIGNHVTNIGEYLFYKCTALTSITISNSVTSIGQYTFYGCIAMTSITIPDSATSIGNEAFYGCSSLAILTLGKNLKSIEADGFSGCKSLSKIYSLNPTPPEINNNTFNGVDKETCQLVVTKGNLVYYWLDPVWKEFLNISDDLLYLSPLPSVKYGDAPVNLADYAPEGYSFVYETSNSDVVRLDGSILTIVGAGKATIGASYQQSGTSMEVMGQMRQFVVDKADLTIMPENITITEGQPIPDFVLTAIGLVYDENLDDIGELPEVLCDVTSSSAPGEYPIYLVGGSSNNYNLILENGVLTIEEIPIVYPESIQLDYKEADIYIGERLQLTATIYPEDTTDKTVVWSSLDETVAAVSESGLVSAISFGSTTIIATCGEVSAECAITVLDDSGVESLLSNPDTKISIYSIDGFLIKKDCKAEDLKTLSKGIYIIVSGKERYKISI